MVTREVRFPNMKQLVKTMERVFNQNGPDAVMTMLPQLRVKLHIAGGLPHS